MDDKKVYIAIDLKSFYASVECVERGLDPLRVNLVVADDSRTDKTICLAVSPSLKAHGVSGRARLFEVKSRVAEVNAARRIRAPGGAFTGKSWYDAELKARPELELDFIIAKPRMAYYIKYSTDIYKIYLNYISPEDIHVYSVDEVFIDLTPYLKTYGKPPRAIAMMLINEVLKKTGITATCGIGPNLYLAKIAMDIDAKHAEPDENGVRIAELDEMSYRERLWSHEPITDFWRIGRGYAKKLQSNGMYTMGDVARRSTYDEDRLYELFGVNAELLIDHAWGWEPCTLKEIKSYRPKSNSLSSGQVLKEPYPHEKTRLIVREMAELLSLDLLEKGLVTDQLTLTIGYDRINLSGDRGGAEYKGRVRIDHYGRAVPEHAHGTANLGCFTSSGEKITGALVSLFDRISDPSLYSRRVTIGANRIMREDDAAVGAGETCEQLDLFTDYEARDRKMRETAAAEAKERARRKAILTIKRKFGKNAIFKGMDLKEGATSIERNAQIGGHKA